MNTLLHICCAPCSIACIESLRAEDIEPVGFWYNPNIHPFTEYRQRRNTLVEYAAAIGLPLVQEGGYGLRQFIARVDGDFTGPLPGMLPATDAENGGVCSPEWIYTFHQHFADQPLSAA